MRIAREEGRMSATIHNWPVRPIVTLVSEFASWETQWHGEDAHTFAGGIQNVLKLLVEFKYQKPYGGSARYRVAIDRRDDSAWTNTITDVVSFYPDPTDTAWHTETKEYELSITVPLFLRASKALDFRITSQIEGPGHMDTGSGSGSPGFWSPAETHEYVATFEKPQLHLVAARVKDLHLSLDEALQHCKKIP
jgi:hypothetical protein